MDLLQADGLKFNEKLATNESTGIRIMMKSIISIAMSQQFCYLLEDDAIRQQSYHDQYTS